MFDQPQINYEEVRLKLRQEHAKKYFQQPEGFLFNDNDFNIDDVALPPNETFGIPDDSDEVEEDQIEFETGYETVIVFDQLPIVTEEKKPKLIAMLHKLVEQAGQVKPDSTWMPFDGDKSKGICLMELVSKEDARAVVRTLDRFNFSKTADKPIRANLYDDIAKYQQVPDTYKPMAPTEKKNVAIHSWLTDPRSREQFVIQQKAFTGVYWNDVSHQQPIEAYSKQYWSEGPVTWSPKGHFIATTHREGVILWGGEHFTEIAKLKHIGAQKVQFSPNEQFVCTASVTAPDKYDVAERPVTAVINVFDRATGSILRRFETPIEVAEAVDQEQYLHAWEMQLQETNDEHVQQSLMLRIDAVRNNLLKIKSTSNIQWPYFRWAGGEKDLYFARLIKNGVSVYGPDMSLLDKKSINLSHVEGLDWCPVQPILATYQREFENQPAKINLFKIPEKVEIKQKSLGFSVEDITIKWHPQGSYLAVYIERLTKTKKSTTKEFEVFRVNERNIPIDILALPNNKDKVHTFEWEPVGKRIALVHSEDRNPRPNVYVYAMKDDKKATAGSQLVGTLEAQNCTDIIWCPTGRYMLICGLRGQDGKLKFFDVDNWQTIKSVEHTGANKVVWDMSGRYVVSTVCAPHPGEHGYVIWSMLGQKLAQARLPDMSLFSWRPKPQQLVPDEIVANTHKRMKHYKEQFEQEDENMVMQADQSVLAEKQQLLNEWEEWLASKEKFIANRETGLRRIMGDQYDEMEYSEIQQQGELISLDKKIEQIEKIH